MTATTYAIALVVLWLAVLILIPDRDGFMRATIFRAGAYLLPLVLVCAVGFDLFCWAVTNG